MKVRATRTIVKEYEVNPDHYPKGSTTEDILKLDQQGLEDEFFDDVDSDVVSLEIIDTVKWDDYQGEI